MARATMTLTDEGVDRFAEVLDNYHGYAGRAINDVLWNEAGPMIAESIMPLLPRSGRTWKGKKAPAASTNPFLIMKYTLAVSVKSKNAYHYLYFPDDGSSTRNHVGNQQFMLRGAEDRRDDIIERCIARLTNFNEMR